ncbi:hypothetical protein KKF84_14940, partial [Myxococcota bacterium]|nr:hypothetical protein [Myxococcota bacterium]MBU1536620.1 hypothetical protein [Myxococcota bacterium]
LKDEPPKSKAPMAIGAVVVVLLLAAGGWYMFGRDKGGASGGGKASPKGIDPKFVKSMQVLDGQVRKKIDFFFQKTCKSYQQAGYSFQTQLTYNREDLYRSIIMPGTGTGGSGEDWYTCPVRIANIRSQADMIMEIYAKFVPAADLFSKPNRFLTVSFKGTAVKPFADFKTGTAHWMNTWDVKLNTNDKKNYLYIGCGALRGPAVIKSLNGGHLVTSKGYKTSLRYTFKHKGVDFVQVKGYGNQFGTYEGKIQGWFGDTYTKYIKDWGTGCQNDITMSFQSIMKKMIDDHTDLEFYKDNPKLKEYMDIAAKGGKKLCEAMPKAYKIIQLYDENKESEAKALTTELETELKAARKILAEELPALMKSLNAKLAKKK